MPRNYWMVTVSAEQCARVVQQGVLEQPIPVQHRRRLERMEPGDRVLFYIGGKRLFPAVATVHSRSFLEEPTLQGQVARNGNRDILFRVEVKVDTLLQERDYLDVRQLGPGMEYVRRWAPEDWPLAFQGNYHLIPKLDFSLVEEEMKKIAAQRAGRFYRPRLDRGRLQRN